MGKEGQGHAGGHREKRVRAQVPESHPLLLLTAGPVMKSAFLKSVQLTAVTEVGVRA